jgi:hypothetical protein
MAKGDKYTPAETSDSQPVEATVDNFPLTLNEFCARLSSTERRVELIGAFAHDERQSGVVKDSQAAFASRFAAFAMREV